MGVASIPIESAADPRIARYRCVRERDLVGREGRFVAESAGVLRVLLSARSRFAPESVFVARERLDPLLPLLEAALPGDVPLYVAPLALMAEVAGFPIHRGVLAIGRRGPPAEAATLVPPPPAPALLVGLLGLTNHDNVGAAFRNAAAFGADAVLLDPATPDPLYRKAIRVSVGASLTVPHARVPDAAALLDRLEAAGVTPLALTPRGAVAIEDLAPPRRAALLLGTEGAGLPGAVIARCLPVRIPMAPGHDSLNVATAAGIALHRLRGGLHWAGDGAKAVDDGPARQ